MSDRMIQSPMTVAFADLWYDTREQLGAPIPAKNDVSLRRLAPFMPRLSLHETEPDGRSRYLLYGTQLVADFGKDLTGTYVDDAITGEANSKRRASFDAFFAEHGEGTLFGRWLFGEAQTSSGRVIQFESLALPYLEPGNESSIRHMTHILPLGTLQFGEGLSPSFVEKAASMFKAAGPRPDWLALDPASPFIEDSDVA